MNSKPALIAYFTAALVFMIAVVLGNDELLLLAKPVIIPSILFYYLLEKKRINWFYMIMMALFFAVDMLALLEIQNFFIIAAVITLCGYLLFLKGLLDNLLPLRFNKFNKSNFFSLLVCTFLLLYFLVISMDLLMESKEDNLWILVLYGMVLVLIGIASALNYLVKANRYTTFMIITSLAFVISDVFFILKRFFFEIDLFNYFNNLIQVLSYYYLTKYYLLKKGRL
ncbi:lysoplasmalogenase family protein [Flavobacterium sp. SM15]|uniref:lysoplasmalogenase family protein n=1 Tax=Flavobacterium sp. SM15 TaxID=2908005 RepID=UPI001EDC74DD|nr:lysoplasmalogenase family protein [Flavobacterium sp. SM15]MCG2612025.1 lysoplasmalogenase family protein [Flavobacterium sp. SM15]